MISNLRLVTNQPVAYQVFNRVTNESYGDHFTMEEAIEATILLNEEYQCDHWAFIKNDMDLDIANRLVQDHCGRKRRFN